MRRALALGLLLALGAGPGSAQQGVARSPVPVPRPAPIQEVLPRVPLAPVHYNATIRPMPRPAAAVPSAPATGGVILLVPVQYGAGVRPHPRPRRAMPPGRVVQVSSGAGLVRSARPAPRPDLRSAAGLGAPPSATAKATAKATAGRSGAICGDPRIRGEPLAPIQGRIAGCGVARPVRVSAVDGVTLRPAATVDCETAQALTTWVVQGVKPAVGRLGGGVASLQVAASYACRTRNNKPGARISEHGRGRAVDISAVTLANGVALNVRKGWDDPVQGKLLRQMHKSACGPFGTVLGPGSDGYHRDHFHFDTARYRGGPYCR